MTNNELVSLFESLQACEPGMQWLKLLIKEKPSLTFEEIWSEAVALNEKVQGVNETHVGWSWCSWVCRHVANIPCSNGTFSGRRKIHDGPNASELKPTDVYEAINRRYA